jgi:hypothetical protein
MFSKNLFASNFLGGSLGFFSISFSFSSFFFGSNIFLSIFFGILSIFFWFLFSFVDLSFDLSTFPGSSFFES